MFKESKLNVLEGKIVDVLVLPLASAEDIEAGDLCYDKFFHANARQVKELRKRTASFYKVIGDMGDQGRIDRDILRQWDVKDRNIWMNSVHGSL